MGGLFQGVGTLYSGIAGGIQEQQSAQREWNTNDALAAYSGRAARLEGEQAAGKARMQGSQMVAAQRLAYANSGVDEKSGTAAAVQADTSAMGELDAQTVQNNAARQAWGFSVAREQAHQQYVGKVNAAQNKMVGSIITGGGEIAGASSGVNFGGGG